MTLLTLFLSFLIFSAYLMFISKERFQNRPILDRLIGAFLLTCFQIVFSELIIGLLGFIFQWVIILVNCITAIIIIWISKPSKPQWKALRLDIVTLAQGFWKVQVKYPLIGLMTFWLAILLAYNTFLAWLLPETVWDSLRYHLPAAAQIIQNHKISDIATDTIFINTYPKNFELLFLWLMLLPGNDLWVNAGQIPFFVFGILTIYRLARLSKLSRHHSWMMGVLLASSPVILQQLTVSLIDVMFSIAVIMGVWGFYRFVIGGDSLDLIFAGVALGLAAGGKDNGVVWFVLLGVFLFIFLLVHSREKNGRRIFALVLLLSIPGILLASYWYGKNWYRYGNPIAPYQFSIAGRTIFKGDMDSYKYLIEDKLSPEFNYLSPAKRIWTVWQEPVIRHNSFGSMGGLGSVWFILMLPALPIAFVISYLKKNRSFLWLCALFMLPFFIFFRYQCFTRYNIFVLAPGLVALGIVFDAFKRASRFLRVLAFFLFIFSSFHGSINKNATPQMMRELIHLPKSERSSAITFSYGNELHSSMSLLEWWHKQKLRDTLLVYHCDQWVFTYPLWDVNIDNRIQYLPEVKTSDLWAQRIRPADWIMVSTGSKEEKWSKAISAFKKVYVDDKFAVYGKKN